MKLLLDEMYPRFIAAIEEMIREGLAERGEFNIREIDDAGRPSASPHT